VKIAVIGGGSTYTPELVDGIARLRDEIEVDHLVLCDPDPTRLDVVAGVSRRIASRREWRGKLTATADLTEALRAAEVATNGSSSASKRRLFKRG